MADSGSGKARALGINHIVLEVGDIDEALERLRCNRCDGPLSATLVSLNDEEEVWDFECKDTRCESHLGH